MIEKYKEVMVEAEVSIELVAVMSIEVMDIVDWIRTN